MAHEFAIRLALIAFITAAVQGLMTGSAFEPALKLSLAAALACYAIGWLCGEIARRNIAESVASEFQPAPAASPESNRPLSPGALPQSPGR